jgi:GTP-binding protein HflX
LVGSIRQKREAPDSRYFIGKGKLLALKELVEARGADLIVFDEKLSPAQVKNLEDQLGSKVIDRGTLILDIFARHARSRESRIQVELAQLQYLLPRLTRMWSHLSRTAGGIGTRGPGETQLESDRRAIGRRIVTLKKQLKKVATQRATQRKGRREAFRIALVGYTNAGKSTLFNLLTRAGVWADDRLFCTLDAVTRYLPLHQQRMIVIADTVGFIRKLPPELVASFASTLDEVRLANLLLHVLDVAHPDSVEHYRKTNQILEEIGAGSITRFLLCNKCDLLQPGSLPIVDPDFDPRQTFYVSAKTAVGLDKMLKFLADFVDKELRASNQ